MLDELLKRIRVQYPNLEPQSLHRSIVQLTLVLQDPEYYAALAGYLNAAGNSGGGAGDCDCCSNVDGGRADSVFGGIFCTIDGGNALGAANPAP